MRFHAVTTAVALVLGMMMTGLSVAEGTRERITATATDHSSTWKFGEINLKIDRYDDGRSQPYRIVLHKDGVRSVHYFLDDFKVKKFTVADETYRITYNSDGTIKKLVDLTPAERRQLAQENEEKKQEEDLVENRRSLTIACEDCYTTWDLMCTHEAYVAMLQLTESGLVPDGTTLAAVEYVREGMYWVCYDTYEAEEACAGQCV